MATFGGVSGSTKATGGWGGSPTKVMSVHGCSPTKTTYRHSASPTKTTCGHGAVLTKQYFIKRDGAPVTGVKRGVGWARGKQLRDAGSGRDEWESGGQFATQRLIVSGITTCGAHAFNALGSQPRTDDRPSCDHNRFYTWAHPSMTFSELW
ncbi:hypothetical protein DFH09DRAFT_1355039 [Mycena vulgaris]|nr:hypothetical protein DFH09DRAFT_1355039 [Mycena vulgaris]